MEDSDFGTFENNETFANKELKEEKVLEISFETSTVVEYWRRSKKKIIKMSVFKNLKSPVGVKKKILVNPIQFTTSFNTFSNELKQLILRVSILYKFF